MGKVGGGGHILGLVGKVGGGGHILKSLHYLNSKI